MSEEEELMLNGAAKVPGGWIRKDLYIPDPEFWIAQYVAQTACKACKGEGTSSYMNQYNSRTATKCDACGGKGR